MYDKMADEIFEALRAFGDREASRAFEIWYDAHRDKCENCNETNKNGGGY